MSPEQTQRLTELRNLITRSRQLYYNHNGRGSVDDPTYDSWVAEYKGIAGPLNTFITDVGAPVDQGNMNRAVTHRRLIGSLNDVKNQEAFLKWMSNLGVAIGGRPTMGSHKMDGLTCELTYENGKLMLAATRGNGTVGEDVTPNAILISNLPRYLTTAFYGNVRGEVYVKVSSLTAINAKLPEADRYANVRNAASGILRAKDGEYAMFLHFAAFDIVDPNGQFGLDSERKKFAVLKRLGFELPTHRYCPTALDATQFFNEVASNRLGLDHWIDGVVFKVDDLQAQIEAGVVGKCPKAAVAYKFPAEEARSVLRAIEWSIGHGGEQVPTAVFDPVEIGGTTVTRASLYNVGMAGNFQIGDGIVVSKRGDIIPKIEKVCSRSNFSKPILMPMVCIACSGPLTSMGPNLVCTSATCPGKAIGKVNHWIDSLEIKGIGEEIVQALMTTQFSQIGGNSIFERGLNPDEYIVRDISDLYRLRNVMTTDLANLIVGGVRLGESRAEAVKRAMCNAQTMTIDQFVGSLGVKGLGKRKVALIREAWAKGAIQAEQSEGVTTLNFVMEWFTKYDGWSWLIKNAAHLGIPGMAVQMQKELDALKPLVDELLKVIVIVEPAPATQLGTGPLAGKSFVLTGTMSRDRKLIAADIVKAGGAVKDKVTKDVTALVQADPSSASSKSKDAAKHGVQIISEEALMGMMVTA